MLIPKRTIIRAPAYRRYVASMPCMACGRHGCQAAHISVGNHARGMKASDDLCLPLCATTIRGFGCHAAFDRGQVLFAKVSLRMTIDKLKSHARAMYQAWHE